MKPVIKCADCVFFAEEYGKCTKLAYGNEPLEVTPEDGCTFGQRAETNDSEA